MRRFSPAPPIWGRAREPFSTQIAAQELGIAPDRITIIMGDTSVVPFDSSTSASRSTVFMGNALVKACRDIKRQLRSMAAEAFQVDEEAVAVEAGRVRLPDRELSYADLMKACFGPPRGEVIGVGQERNRYIADHPLGGKPAFWELMCVAAEVEVDPETGMVRVLKLVLASDIGKALNPAQVEAQDEGAAVMGLGHTLMEQLILDEHGRILNLGSLDYRIPTVEDAPRKAAIHSHRERRRSGAVWSQGRRRGRHSGDCRRHRLRRKPSGRSDHPRPSSLPRSAYGAPSGMRKKPRAEPRACHADAGVYSEMTPGGKAGRRRYI